MKRLKKNTTFTLRISRSQKRTLKADAKRQGFSSVAEFLLFFYEDWKGEN